VGNPAREDRRHLRVVPRDRVADDHAVDVFGQPFGIEAETHRNPELFEQKTHGWVELGIDTFDVVAELVQHSGQRGHRRASDGQEVEALSLEV
jgi:hypothetical protein